VEHSDNQLAGESRGSFEDQLAGIPLRCEPATTNIRPPKVVADIQNQALFGIFGIIRHRFIADRALHESSLTDDVL